MSEKPIFDPERLDNALSMLPTVAPGNGVPLSFDPVVDSPRDAARPEALQRSLSLASTVDPDTYAKQAQLAKGIGVDPGAVTDYESVAKRAALFKEIAPDTLSVTNPGVADFLITPHHAKLAQDDVPNLSFIDNALKQLGSPGDVLPQVNAAQLMYQKSLLDDKVQNGTASEADKRALKSINYSYGKWASMPGAGSAFGVAGQVAGLYAVMQPEAVAWAEAGAAIGTGGALMLGQTPYTIGLPEELVTVPAAARTFGGLGYRAGLANAMYRLEGTQAYNASIEAGDPEWRAQVNKFVVGSTNAALEMVGFNILMRPFSPLKKMIQARAAARMAEELAVKAGGEAIESAAEAGVKKAVKPVGEVAAKAGKEYLKTTTSEAGIEGLQRVVSESVPEFTRAATEAGYSVTPERAEEILWAGLEETVTAAKGMTLLALPGTAFQVYTGTRKAERAKEQAQVFDNLISAVEASKTRARNEEVFSSFVKGQAEKTGSDRVYVSSEQMGEVLHQLGLTVEKVRAISPELAAQVENPGNIGGDITIPIETYLTKVSGTDLGNALHQHVRLDPDGFSIAESEEFEAMRPALVEAASQEINEKAEAKKAFDDELKGIAETLGAQLKESAPHLSATETAQIKKVILGMTSVAASRANISPTTVYNRIVSQMSNMEDFTGARAAADEVLEQSTMTKRAWVEIAPSPDDMTWAPKWKSMNDAQRLSISRHMIAKFVPLIESLVPKAKVATREHIGSFEGDTNYSYTIKANGGSLKAITNALGYLFAQKGMVSLSDKKFPGSFTANALHVSVAGKSLDEIHDMYLKIRALEGFPQIEGQTTLEDEMLILISDKADPHAMGAAIQELFNNEHEVTYDQVEAAFPGEKEYDYSNKKVELEGDLEENRGRYRRLRAEFLRERNSLIDEALNPSGKLKGLEEVASLESAFAKAAETRSKTNRAFKIEVQNRVKAEAKKAGIDLEHFTPEVEGYLVRVGLADALTALRTHPDAVGWYNEKVTIALEVLSLIHPEIATNKMSKFAFTWALAVTSNGMKVDKNFTLAEKAYSIYKETGKMPTDIGEGNASANINEGLEAFNDLVAEHGIETIEDFMTGLHTVKEIKEFTGRSVSGEHTDVKAYGAAAVGPKIGNGFFANLYGHYEQLTMDRWFMRTWGRWTGTLVNVDKKKVDAGRARLKTAIGRMTSEQKSAFRKATGVQLLVGNLDDTAFAIKSASQTAEVRALMNAIPHGEEIRKAGNNLSKIADGQKETPGNGKERKQIRTVMSQVLAELQITHPELTMADMQALLWYPEKKLYDSAKLEDTEEVYEEGEAPDYANAAVKLAEEKGVDADKIKGAIENAKEKILRTNGRTAVARRGKSGPEGSQTVFEQAGRPARPRAIPATRSWVAAVKAEYGEQREGVAPILGVHFSDRSRETLSGSFYGKGMQGEEAGRLRRAADKRISKRIHFYVDEGQAIVPEVSVGHHIHAVKLNNIYHLGEDPLGFKAQWGEMSESDWSNAMESAVIDAGYDGYYRPAAQGAQGVAVLLGDHEVNADQMGLGYALWERVNTAGFQQMGAPLPDTIDIDGVQRSTRNSEGYRIADTEEGVRAFWKWFGDSKVVDEQGRPKVVYHGTVQGGFDKFNTEGTGKTSGTGAWFVDNEYAASTYSGTMDDIQRPPTADELLRASDLNDYGIEVYAPGEEGELWEVSSPNGYSYEAETLREALEDMEADGELQEAGPVRGNYPVYLRIPNSLVLDADGSNWDDLQGSQDTTDDVARQAREEGFDGVIFSNLMDEGPYGRGGTESTVYAVFNPSNIKSTQNVGTFNRRDDNIYKQGARASWNPETLVMLLSEESDMSSVLHEFGHGFLSFYTKLAEQIDSDQGVRDDVQALMDWFGVKNLLEWNQMSLEEQRPYHEQFAYNWEKYLFTGKAPTTQLKNVFAKMSQWAKELYTGLVQRLNATYREQFGRDLPGLTPEITKVFDRMIASEEHLNQAGQIEGLMASFGVRPEGMSDEMWTEYNEMWEESRNDALTELTSAMLRALKWESGARGRVLKELQGEAKEARNKIKAEITAEVQSRPVSILRHFIKTGELRTPEGVKAVGPALKISIAAAKRLLPSHKERITEEVMAELMQEPEYRAERFIRTGELDAPGDLSNADRKALDEVTSGTRSRKLDLGALKKIFKDEPEVWKGLRSRGLTAPNGINPNTLARLLQIKDLQTLLSIMEAKPDKLKKKLDKEVKARLSKITEPDVNYKALGTGKNGMLAEQGADPELIAEDFRAIFPESPIFETAEGMLTALVGAQNEQAEIDRATDKRMIEENSDMLDAADIDLKVRKAIHNKMLAKVVSIEHKFLTGSTKPVNLTRRAARAVAHEMLMKIRLGRLDPVAYSKLSGRSARLATKLMGKGDVAGAGRAKQGQLLQAEAFVEALHLKSVADQWLEKADRYRKDAAAKRVGDKGIEQIRQILYRYGISTRVPTQAEIESRRPLAEHLQYLESQGYIGLSDIVPDFIKDETHTMPYSQLTVEQFDQLMQTVNALDKLGSNEIKQRDMEYKEGVAASSAMVAESIVDNVRKPRARKVAQTRMEKKLAGAKSFAWGNVTIASIVRIFDGDKDNGSAFREIMAPANKAGDQEASMRAEAAQELEAIFQDAFGKHRVSLRNFATNVSQGTVSFNYLREKIHIPALEGTPGYEDGKFTRGTLMVMALNLGNEGNKRLLLENYGWTEGQIQAAMSNLTESELRAVQKIWNYYEQFRPLIAESTRRREGREPQWTVPVPVSFRSSDGKEVNLAGGHFPIRYDTRGMTREDGQVTLEGILGDPMTERRQQVVTAHGFEMERTKGKDTPILLDPSVIFIGINEIVHDVAWRDTLIRINQMVKSPALKNAILSNYGEDVYNQFTRWITDVAVGNQVPAGDGAKLATFVGQNISFSRMAMSMTTLVKQHLGLIQSIPWLGDGDMRVGSALLLGSLRSYLTNMKGTHEFIGARSSFMRMRGSTMLRDLVELKNVLHGESDIIKTIKVNGFTLIARAQSIVDAITWMAAYNKNVAVYGEQQAAQIADQAVKSSQGSGLLHDLPATMREEGTMRLFTAFYSYRNATFNRLMVAGKTQGVISGKFAAEGLTLLIIQVMAERLLMELLTGDDDDDDENAVQRTLAAAPADVFGYTTSLLPGVSEASGLGEIAFPTGDYGVNYSGPARLAIFKDLYVFAGQAMQGEFDDAFLASVVNFSGSAFGIPSAQINRSIKGTQAVIEGETEGPVDTVLAPFFGPRK